MFFLAKYGIETTFTFPMVKRGVVDLAVTGDWTPATGDTKASKDAGTVANTTNNPAIVAGTGSVDWSLTLTATELTAAVVDVQIVDSATKAVEDQYLKIYTYGHASAKIPLDLSINQTGDSFARIGATGSGLTSLATQTSLDTLDNFVDTEIADILARLPAALVSGRMDSSLGAAAAGVLAAAAFAADMNSYTTRTWIAKEGTANDKYIIQWVKNGQIVTSGITLPKIRVYNESGTNLIAETAMTEIGSTQSFKFEEATNKLVAGEIYMVEAKATIDGSVQLDRQPVMRDSA